jgi:hypothetical protein
LEATSNTITWPVLNPATIKLLLADIVMSNGLTITWVFLGVELNKPHKKLLAYSVVSFISSLA